MSVSHLGTTDRIKANGWGLLTSATLAFAMKLVGVPTHLGRDVAGGIAFGVFIGVSAALFERRIDPDAALGGMLKVGVIKGIAGGLGFTALLEFLS